MRLPTELPRESAVELPSGCRITIEDKPAPADRNRLGRELGKHNRPFLCNPEWQRLGVFVRDGDGDIAADLAGHTYGAWLFVEDLWVRADLRGGGIGRELLAPWFYPKFGYTVFGALDYPPGEKRFFLQKRLTAEGL
jgi:GNAT superfamily N-acetyltransferase